MTVISSVTKINFIKKCYFNLQKNQYCIMIKILFGVFKNGYNIK